LHTHHHHDHHHHHAEDSSGMIKAFWLNIVFSIIELIGGVFTNSMAIISDAIHDIGDAIAIGLAIVLEKFSQKQRDKNFSYGYRRFSTLSAFITSTVLLIGSIWIVTSAIPRLINPEEVNSEGMLILAVVGIIFNGAAVLNIKKGPSLNSKAVRLHLMEDVLGWVAVLIGGTLIYFFNWLIIDPILSIAIAVYILINAFVNLKSVFTIFLQGVPHELNLKEIEREIKQIEGIKEIHDMHLWSMDGNFNVLTLHAVVNEDSNPEKVKCIKKDARSLLKSKGVQHLTIEIETNAEECELQNC
jgi:cobalt-zinc-cadmium efflux system protein